MTLNLNKKKRVSFIDRIRKKLSWCTPVCYFCSCCEMSVKSRETPPRVSPSLYGKVRETQVEHTHTTIVPAVKVKSFHHSLLRSYREETGSSLPLSSYTTTTQDIETAETHDTLDRLGFLKVGWTINLPLRPLQPREMQFLLLFTGSLLLRLNE